MGRRAPLFERHLAQRRILRSAAHQSPAIVVRAECLGITDGKGSQILGVDAV
jgi:hypothetical protein